MAHAGDDGFYMLRPNQPDLLDRVAPERSEAWRRLALAFLHAYVLDGVVRKEICGGQPPKVEYVKSATAAVNRAKQSNGTAFLMQATTMSEMRAVCGAGDLMPQKSTFFYPKLASGLVVNALE
jgi:hypothetical protein